jgi:hypothetical protein
LGLEIFLLKPKAPVFEKFKDHILFNEVFPEVLQKAKKVRLFLLV